NGVLSTTAQLCDIVGPLMDVASQHEHQSLGQVKNHLEALDAFARAAALRAAMAASHRELRDAERALEEIASGERSRAEREDFLRFQLAQIDELAPKQGEDSALARERERLRAAEKLAGAARRGEEALWSGEAAAADRASAVARELGALVQTD